MEFITKQIKGYANDQKGNTHFAIHKATNSIVFTWDYKGYDKEDLRDFKEDYFFIDIEDQIADSVDKFKKSDYKIITRNNLEKNNIDLNDYTIFYGQKY